MITASRIKLGETKSCGCLRDEALRARSYKHGRHTTNSKEYRAWRGAKDRCYNEKNKHYADYGGRGIRMAAEWRNDFTAFYDHLGSAPSPKYMIDRIDVNGHYEPGNVCWATPIESRANRRDSVRV